MVEQRKGWGELSDTEVMNLISVSPAEVAQILRTVYETGGGKLANKTAGLLAVVQQVLKEHRLVMVNNTSNFDSLIQHQYKKYDLDK